MFIDGIEVGAVYYELKKARSDGSHWRNGKVSGELILLEGAFKEGGAVLMLDNGREVSVQVTDVYRSEGKALVKVRNR